MYRPAKRGYAMAIYGVANVGGPTLGPVVGNWAAQFKGWTWPIWILIWASGFSLVFLFFFFPETSANYILYQRTERLKRHQSDDGSGLTLKCQPGIMAGQMSPGAMAKMTLIRPFTLCFGEPIVFALNLYTALIYAVLYCWLESVPLVFAEYRGYSLGQSGLFYLGLIVGGILTIPAYFAYNYYLLEPRFNENGELTPEIRMETALVGCFFLPLCLFLFGWTGETDIHWIVPVIGTCFFTAGAIGSVSPSSKIIAKFVTLANPFLSSSPFSTT